MTPAPTALENRINAVKSVLIKQTDKDAIEKELTKAKGDIAGAMPSLKKSLSAASLKKIALAHSLAEWSGDNPAVVKAFAKQRNVGSLRDVALQFDAKKIAATIDPKSVPSDTPGKTADQKTHNYAADLHDKLFHAHTSAVLQRMVRDKEVPIAGAAIRSGVLGFLDKQPDFNIRTTSIDTALKKPGALKGVPAKHRSAVIEHLKTLQRVQAISPTADAVPTLMKANLTSAFHVSNMGESTFLAAHSRALGEETARQVYNNAINARVRNEHVLMAMHDSVRGTGIGLLDRNTTTKDRVNKTQRTLDQHGVALDLNQLFGGIDYCECDECSSVYSPASYLVELFEYLRNNNLSPKSGQPKATKGYAGTPLEQLFRRRPDLGCIELTCENTYTVLPYVDLANEVMEGFVAHFDSYAADTHTPKQATLEAFNIADEPSSELIAQPQHINYLAYCRLKNAVYPFSLPYHQPIDAARILLEYMGTTREELLRRFGADLEDTSTLSLSAADDAQVQALHRSAQQRAIDAEALGIAQEEYIILTRQAFWSKEYFQLRLKQTFSDAAYQQKIGVRSVYEYYGYTAQADMMSLDPTKGLTWVRQFLSRTGVTYTDVVQLLQTRSINPLYPQGRALTVMDSLRMSYRSMQALVVTSSSDPKVRFAKLINTLQTTQGQLLKLDALLHPDPCHQHPKAREGMVRATELKQWVECWFERIGKLIVIETGDGPRLSVSGDLYGPPPKERGDKARPKPVATLRNDGTIVDTKGRLIGQVNYDGSVTDSDGKSILADLKQSELFIVDPETGTAVGTITSRGLNTGRGREGTPWGPTQDSCNLDKARLIHLDGSPVTIEEYDRIQRFVRLWCCLSWTIDEVDKALLGFAAPSSNGLLMTDTAAPVSSTTAPAAAATPQSGTDFTAFADNCASQPVATSSSGKSRPQPLCPAPPATAFDITPELLHQLAAIKKLQAIVTRPLIALLSLWADVSTSGSQSLYATLFLTHNVSALDPVFKSDVNGNFLTAPAKISEHVPALMAALQLKSDEIAAIVRLRQMSGVLDLPSLSILYRHGLFARILGVRVSELPRIFALLGDPFIDAQSTLRFKYLWTQIADAGFTYRQLDFVINDHDDPKQQLSPSFIKILQISKTLHDGLRQIDIDQSDPDAANPEALTDDLVRTKASLLYDAATVEQIVDLISGTTVYTTNAPVLAPAAFPKIPAYLSKKVHYTLVATPVVAASVQVTGILSSTERTDANNASSDPLWVPAIDRIWKQSQAGRIFDDVLAPVFQNIVAAKAVLLGPDVSLAPPALSSAPTKRLYFLQAFMPFLRRRLARQFVVDTMSSTVGLDGNTTEALLGSVLVAGLPPGPAIEVLLDLKTQLPGPGALWKGYLIAPADDSYIFSVTSTASPPVWQPPPAPAEPMATRLDGMPLNFPHQQEDPNNVWSSDPVVLKRGRVYEIEIASSIQPTLSWKRPATAVNSIPPSALIPDDSTQVASSVFVRLKKAAIVASGFALDAAELNYFQSNPADFDGLDLNAFSLTHWKRLRKYATLRDALPKTDFRLIDLFNWCSPANISALPPPANAVALLPGQIVSATRWDIDRVTKLIANGHLNLAQPGAFVNETNLRKMQRALAVADKTGMDIDRLFEWAVPGSQFWACHTIAEAIRNALQSRFVASDWAKVVKPLNDKLRESQKQALIAYLLAQRSVVEWGATDADSLFEFFLIDVQMCTCMQTSRIKQAIASVQQYVQRCMLGLEEPCVATSVLDRDRWAWMQKYRLWEANRKIFLYPENWLLTSLRDDKSPFYKELESELLQKDIDPDLIEVALRRFLYKVDEVGNMLVVGVHVAAMGEPDQTLHVFARTRNTPNIFYYRSYGFASGEWMPWEKMAIDVPQYEEVARSGATIVTGAYLIPVVWNHRLLVFFPEFLKKSAPKGRDTSKSYSDAGDDEKVGGGSQNEYWELKLSWTERREDQWTQKQISSDRAFHYYSYDQTSGAPSLSTDTPSFGTPQKYVTTLPNVGGYVFVPRQPTSSTSTVEELSIDAYFVDPGGYVADVARFVFGGNELHYDPVVTADSWTASAPICLFQLFGSATTETVYSTQAAPAENPPLLGESPHFDSGSAGAMVTLGSSGSQDFFYRFTHELLKAANTEDLDGLYATFQNVTGFPTPANSASAAMDEAFGVTGTAPALSYNELKAPYSIYNWELGFHAVVALVEKMAAAQQFDDALSTFHYVFDPSSSDTDAQRCWKFPPFKKINAQSTLEEKFLSLKPGVADPCITNWRNQPFEPHVVARGRPVAYMKWVAMKYIRLLVDYGDYYFRQNTLETVPLAIQCYVLASHIFGPKPEVIPKRGKIQPETYQSLLDKWDAFGNAIVELELIFPFSNQITSPLGSSNGAVGLPNIFGFATSLYFGIPPNSDLLALRALIDDRLYKIRHCEDINGVFRQLPLFEPEIDPLLLVEAEALGLSLDSVLTDLSSPTPNYRFNYLLQKAYAYAGEVKSLGAAYLAAREKEDAEALARLKATHETSLYTLVLEVKKQQLEEANRAMDALEQGRKAPVNRLQHYLRLIGADLSQVPSEDADFAEIADPIEAPTESSGLVLSSYEKEEMENAAAAALAHDAVGRLESIGGILSLIPEFDLNVQLFGIGPSVSFGGRELSAFTQATARMAQVIADELSFESSNAGRKSGYLRQLQDRVLQANIAGLEIKSIDKQILTQKIRIDIATKEIANQQKQIDDAQAVEDFLHSKYSNQELYTWMQDSLRTLYYQGYGLAYDMASRAAAVYRFERPLSASFIGPGYWDGSHDGLLAGEQLESALRAMELAYVADRPYDFEVSRPQFSLREIDPLALIELRASGACEFSLPEVLFDRDFAGDYMRRVKTVALEVPCVVGPGVSLNCRLKLLAHRFRTNTDHPESYPESTDPADDRFSTVNVPIVAIAASTGQNEHGVFELSFNGERYLPFEGAGVISTWRLELPPDIRAFDYETISDVGIRIQYTSCSGGDIFKAAAAKNVVNFLSGQGGLGTHDGLFAAFELARDFPDQWYRTVLAGTAGTTTFSLDTVADRVPYYAQSLSGKKRPSNKIRATDIYFVYESPFGAAYSAITFAGTSVSSPDSPFTNAPGLSVLSMTSTDLPSDQWTFSFDYTAPAPPAKANRAWLVVRFTLQ